ncbi:hypothetical protein, unlikely [Trypanosoma brucei gambiense DAL972]|uniref:Uncharacterized protein n=1 Tax=Trypanosoma brucei gambiense (strain MHOM/CI/86/DAL972) TaxID=679716 RepID=D0A1S5_TRYB9|nr:hypothetical protein, unlikely [Trypanosoma brucei gambiense DAL972]CBH15218.1 hypothetical protein, unlikely [Trypanosoma brucei gambiense DAL972]|eukprot:XP_011777483.1 hypothetical protein, unlikely [Trypanosoma brucei gambiense DAL972]
MSPAIPSGSSTSYRQFSRFRTCAEETQHISEEQKAQCMRCPTLFAKKKKRSRHGNGLRRLRKKKQVGLTFNSCIYLCNARWQHREVLQHHKQKRYNLRMRSPGRNTGNHT